MQAREPARSAREATADKKIVVLGYVSVRAAARIADPQVRRQTDAIGNYCRRKEWDLLTLLRDVDAGPGKGGDRPALRNAVDRLRRREASGLVVADLRHLCPSIAELGAVLQMLERADARFVSLDPPFDTGTLPGRAIARALMDVSGWERARRVKMTAAARSKGGAGVPVGLRRRIVQMRNAGLTLQAIADRLNEDGVPTVRGGARWRPSSVQATLGYKRPRSWSGGDDALDWEP